MNNKRKAELISNQFVSIAQVTQEGQQKKRKIISNNKRLPGTDLNELKKVSKLPMRKVEFPQQIVNDEEIKTKKIQVLKNRSSNSNSSDISEREISGKEVLIFILFTLFTLLVTFMQLEVTNNYMINFSIGNWLKNVTFSGETFGHVSYDQIQTSDDLYAWYESFLGRDIYNNHYHEQSIIPEHKMYSIAHNNFLISPVRITQRMIKQVDNNDPLTKNFMPKKWISVKRKIDSQGPYDPEIEFNDTIKLVEKEYKYQKEGSFQDLGGYVVNFDVRKQSLNDTKNQIWALKDNMFINNQTQNLVTDFMVYNPYSDIYTIVVLVTYFKPNGHLDNSKVQFMNIRGFYYDKSSGSTLARAIFEIGLVIIVGCYIIIEVNEILKKIYGKMNNEKKAREFEQAKEQRRLDQQKRNKKVNRDKGHKAKTEDDDDDEDSEEFSEKCYVHDQNEHKESNKNEIQEQAQKAFRMYVLGIIKFTLMGVKEHFNDFWNALDGFILILSAIGIVFWIIIINVHSDIFVRPDDVAFDYSMPSNVEKMQEFLQQPGANITSISSILKNVSQNTDMYYIGYKLQTYSQIQGALVFFVLIKFLSYLKMFNSKVGMLFEVIQIAKVEYVYFLIMFMLIFFAFQLCFRIQFGYVFEQFNSEDWINITVWRFLLNDSLSIGIIDEYSPGISNLMKIAFAFIFGFVLKNIIRSIISHAYYQVVIKNKTEQSFEEILQERHWIVRLHEMKDPFLKYVSSFIEKKTNETKNQNAKKLGTLVQKVANAAMNKDNQDHGSIGEKRQEQERKNLEEQRLAAQQRVKLERKYLEAKKAQNMFVNAFKSKFIANLQQDLDVSYSVASDDKSSIDENELSQFKKRQSIREEAVAISEMDKGLETNANDLSFEDNMMDDQNLKQNEEEKERQEEQMKKLIQMQEEEKAKYILQRMDWDKNFGEDGEVDDVGNNRVAAFMSEYEENVEEKSTLIKCGRILWSSMIYGLYLFLVIIVVQTQLHSDYKFAVNAELDDYLRSLTYTERYTNLTVDFSKLDIANDTSIHQQIRLEEMRDLNDIIIVLKHIIPSLGQNQNITSSLDPDYPMRKSQFDTTFLNSRRYFVGDFIRLSFKFYNKNPVFQAVEDYLNNTQSENLLVVPTWLMKEKSTNQTQCQDIKGKTSNYIYECNQLLNNYQVYINMTKTDEEALVQQKAYQPGKAFEFRSMSYQQILQRLVDDEFFTPQLKQMDIDFVTYEAFYDLHSLTNINMLFSRFGYIDTNIKTRSMRLDIFQTTSDYFNLALSIIYLILFLTILYTIIFGRFSIINKYRKYLRWMKSEIEYLSAVEKRQRQLRKPEFMRIISVLFDGFTLINCIYSVLTIISLVEFVQLSIDSQYISLKTYPVWPNPNQDYQEVADQNRQQEIRNFMDQFEMILQRFDQYKEILTVSVIFVTFKLFQYFMESRNMRQLINVLTSVMTDDLLNYMVIFVIISLAFMSIAHLSFGSQIEQFSSISRAFLYIFEFSLPNTFNLSFLDLTIISTPGMTKIFFYPITIMFLLVISNLFLAIMMNNYELHVVMKREQQASHKVEQISLLKSLCYCLIASDGQEQNSESKKKKAKQVQDDLIIGIDQTPTVFKKPEFLEDGFDPYDPDIKYNQEHYLLILDSIDINMQMNNMSVEVWTAQAAREIQDELAARTRVRDICLTLQQQKMANLQGDKRMGQFDEFNYQQKRIEYWNYIRNAIQLINFQTKLLNCIINLKNIEIQDLSEELKVMVQVTDKLYLKVGDLEEPLEIQLKKNMELGKIIHNLEKERQILQQSYDNKDYQGYNHESKNKQPSSDAAQNEDYDEEKIINEGIAEESDEDDDQIVESDLDDANVQEMRGMEKAPSIEPRATIENYRVEHLGKK